ncbi:MAG: nucleotidyltransferase domain-containing protein, partial [Candidatus Anammoxibacter sp.]
MEIEIYLKKIVEKITINFDPEKIILFGSYAYGQPTVAGDLDLLVVMDT